MEPFISVDGPVENVNGKLTLRIPLWAGGEDLAKCAKGIGQVEGNFLNVVIPDWLAEKLKISEGAIVNVNNQDGRFSIVSSVSQNDEDS